jgi:hypothetical protein
MVSKVLVIIAALLTFAYAHADTRYCGEPKRYENGRIVRSLAVLEEFKRQYPLPAHLKRNEFEINHVIPLVCGGCDSVENLIWMHKLAKTCAEDYCQDRHERITMCPKK